MWLGCKVCTLKNNTFVEISLVEMSKNRRGGCPCEHVTPCHKDCTCVQPYSSRGCTQCCNYGSPEQQRTAAERLVAAHNNPNVKAALEHERRTIQVALFSLCKNRYKAFDEFRTGGSYRFLSGLKGCDKCEICNIGQAIQIGNYAGATRITPINSDKLKD